MRNLGPRAGGTTLRHWGNRSARKPGWGNRSARKPGCRNRPGQITLRHSFNNNKNPFRQSLVGEYMKIQREYQKMHEHIQIYRKIRSTEDRLRGPVMRVSVTRVFGFTTKSNFLELCITKGASLFVLAAFDLGDGAYLANAPTSLNECHPELIFFH